MIPIGAYEALHKAEISGAEKSSSNQMKKIIFEPRTNALFDNELELSTK